MRVRLADPLTGKEHLQILGRKPPEKIQGLVILGLINYYAGRK
jgi:hypothetical protein